MHGSQGQAMQTGPGMGEDVFLRASLRGEKQ